MRSFEFSVRLRRMELEWLLLLERLSSAMLREMPWLSLLLVSTEAVGYPSSQPTAL